MIPGSILAPLQAAVFARLTGDAPFMALAKAVFDDVPEERPFPYVDFGETTEDSWDTFGQSGSEAALTLHIWSRYKGYLEAQNINAALIALLDNDVALAIEGYETVLLNFESTVQFRDPDGITRHLVTRFRVMADAT